MNSNYLNDLIRDLWLTKPKSDKLIDSLIHFGFVDHHHDKSRGKKFLSFYSNHENIIYCNDVKGLIELFLPKYDPKDWYLFLDSSDSSLKGLEIIFNIVFAI